MIRYIGLAIIFVSVSVSAFATPQTSSVPEIDPGSAASAVALLSGGFMVLRARTSRTR